MNTLRTKAIVLSIVFTMCVLAMPLAKVKADSFPSTFYVNNDTFYDAAAIFGAYTQLNADQREIASYLLGMYNLFYLGARGFQFEAGAYKNESEFIAKIKSFGYRIFTGSDGTALHSRFDANFCKYASAVLLYASRCNNVTFSTWFANLDEDFVIPVDQGILNSFTLMYNDNSPEGVANFGDIETPWNSGNTIGYAFTGIQFYDQVAADRFASYTSSQPFVFSALTDNGNIQYVIKPFYGLELIDTLVINRNSYEFCFGSNYNHVALNVLKDVSALELGTAYNGTRITANERSTFLKRRGVESSNNITDLSDLIDYAFTLTPYMLSGNTSNDVVTYWYPYISHVFLVDDFINFSNPEEVFNTDSFDLIGLPNSMLTPIDTVKFKPKVITTIDLPDNTNTVVDIQDMFSEDNVVDENDDPVNPWQINVVVQPNETNPISINVNLFSSGKVYLEYLWEHTKKIAQFAKDILDCFEFEASDGSTYGPKYAIYGVLVLGMAGGMIAKFLL